jgi:hypothetical protein
MQKQKVFCFAARLEGNDSMISLEELRQMASGYVSLYGESCLNDPETPTFVRQLMAKRGEAELPRAG